MLRTPDKDGPKTNTGLILEGKLVFTTNEYLQFKTNNLPGIDYIFQKNYSMEETNQMLGHFKDKNCSTLYILYWNDTYKIVD